MNDRFFACRTCRLYVDAGYRWCYWELEDPGTVRRGAPVDVAAVEGADRYWRGAGENAWLAGLLPLAGEFLHAHQAHDLVYGDLEDIGVIPADDADEDPSWREVEPGAPGPPTGSPEP